MDGNRVEGTPGRPECSVVDGDESVLDSSKVLVQVIRAGPPELRDGVTALECDTFEVFECESGAEVLEALEGNHVDCVLSAYRLPDMSGVDLCSRVRERSCDLPFVLAVRDGSEQIASAAIDVGVTQYVPFDDADSLTQELPTRIETALTQERDCVATDQLESVEAAVEHAADAVLITDTDGTIEYVNPAFEEATGYSREEALGRNPRILKSGAQDESYYEQMWNAILGGDVWEEEILNERKSGEQYVAHQTVAPVTGCDESVRKFVGIQRDVTRQHRLEEQIDRAATTLSRVYDVTSDSGMDLAEKVEAVLEIGCRHLDFPVGYVTRIQGGTQRILAASGDHELIQPGAADPLERTYCRETITQSEPVVVDDVAGTDWEDDPAFERFGLRCYLGTEITVDGDTYGTLCFGGEQPREGTVLDALQSTVETLANWLGYEIERHRYEWRLERKNERLDEFASIVSHDLRNPLNVATLQVDLAQNADDPAEQLEQIADAHERMSNIIEDTLTLAREGHVVEEMTPISVRNLAEQCWETVDTENATLEIDEDSTVRGDPDRLRHVFENLFRNSVEHAGEGVTVTVGPTDSGFYVADDGPGIDTEEDVFASGYSTSETGTGFGLAIVERVAEAHGWSVFAVDSESGGARFEFDTTDGHEQSDDPMLGGDAG